LALHLYEKMLPTTPTHIRFSRMIEKAQRRFSQLTTEDVNEIKRWIDEMWENYKRLQLNV